MAAFRDLLAWLLGWKSARGKIVGPYQAAAQVFVAGMAAGQPFTAGIDAGEVYAY